MNDASTAVKIEQVGWRYNHEEVLARVDLEIKQGEFLGLIGPNGSGKTTLLKIVLGVLKPRDGRVYLWGEEVKNFKDWWRIGYVPQRAASQLFHFPITVGETVDMGLVGKKSKKSRSVAEALANVGLAGFDQRILGELSGGQQQRVMIARALVSSPELLILDEPTTGVDAEAQEEFYELLKKLNQEMNLTLILVSHDVDVVVNEVTTIACINKRLICHVPSKEFIKGNYLETTYGKNMKFIVHGH